MVLKVFITAVDETSVQFWLLSINHTDPQWTDSASGRCEHAWGAGSRAEGPMKTWPGVICLHTLGLQHRTSSFRLGDIASAVGRLAMTTILWCFIPNHPALLLFLSTEWLLGVKGFCSADVGGPEKPRWQHLRNPVAALLGICPKKWPEGTQKRVGKGASCRLSNHLLCPVKMTSPSAGDELH